jgi:hypothetical protein
MVVLSHLLLPDAAQAGVLQRVFAERAVNGMGVNSAREDVFGVTSTDITRDIFAQIGAFPDLGYQATSSAGRFGSVWLSAALNQSGVVSVDSRVIVASDEFVNLTGAPQQATANFIIDGGFLLLDGGRNARATYHLSPLGANLGNVPIETDQSRFAFLNTPCFPVCPEFSTSGVLEADASGNLSFMQFGEDIGATFKPPGLVDIPLSFQSFDLGIVNPSDRLYLKYDFILSTEVGTHIPILTPGAAEGIFAQFSDPFNLSGHPVLPTITLQPLQQPPTVIPEPSTFILIVVGALVLLGCT